MSQEEKKSKAKKKKTAKKVSAKLVGYGAVLTFLMVWVFILGVLTGRGDLNYLLHRLGVYQTNLAARLGMGQSPQAPVALPVAQPAEEPKALADAAKTPAPESEGKEITSAVIPSPVKTSEPAAAKAPVESAKKSGTASLAAKKSKGSSQPKPDKDTSLAAKLDFQNSLDTSSRKLPKTAPKKEATVHTAAIAPHSAHTSAEPAAREEKKKAATTYQIRVGSYRTTEEAQKVMAELKKKGVNVSLQKGKDPKGNLYIIRTGCYNNKSEAEKVNKKLQEARLSGQIQEIH